MCFDFTFMINKNIGHSIKKKKKCSQNLEKYDLEMIYIT